MYGIALAFPPLCQQEVLLQSALRVLLQQHMPTEHVLWIGLDNVFNISLTLEKAEGDQKNAKEMGKKNKKTNAALEQEHG